MANYKIPMMNVDKFEKAVQRFINKCPQITLTKIGPCEVKFDNKTYSGIEYELNDNYNVGDWQFVATIDHTNDGNIVRAVGNFENKVPEKFFTVPAKCDACGLERNRKDTYIVYNNDTKEFKQVGKSCLKDYTGLNPTTVAEISEIPNFKEYEEIAPDAMNFRYETKSITKEDIYGYILNNGYDKNKSGEQLYSAISDWASANKNSIDISEINNWVSKQNPTSDYMRNAVTAWKKDVLEGRDVKLDASLVAVYLREKQNVSEHTGPINVSIGDKISLTVKSSRVLFTNSYHVGYHNDVISDTYEIIGTDNLVYIWATQNKISDGDKIAATVKNIKDYKGVKQIIITRGKIVGKDEEMLNAVKENLDNEKKRTIEALWKAAGNNSDTYLKFIWSNTRLADIQINKNYADVTMSIVNNVIKDDEINNYTDNVKDLVNDDFGFGEPGLIEPKRVNTLVSEALEDLFRASRKELNDHSIGMVYEGGYQGATSGYLKFEDNKIVGTLTYAKRIVITIEFKSSTSDSVSTEANDAIRESEQEYTSAETSINKTKLPALFNLVKFQPQTINLDYGGGKFDNAVEYLKSQNVINLVYDKYNRSTEHNNEVIKIVEENGGADTITCSNVLNVIKEESVRHEVIENIYDLLKAGGTAYFTVYEGKGTEGPTSSGYQLHRKTDEYLEEIQSVFPNTIRKGKLIICKK